MKTKLFVAAILLTAFFVLLPEPDETPAVDVFKNSNDFSNLSRDFIIRNVRLYDGNTLQQKTDIYIENFRVKKIGNITAASNNITQYDGKGKTLLPGFVDAHTHAYGDALKDALNFGVTTEIDMFTMPEAANSFQTARDQVSNIQHADLFSSTILATVEGGHGTEYGLEIPVLSGASQADGFVKERIAQGADYIKAVYNSKKATQQPFPSISLDVLSSLTRSAHQQGKLLLVHVDNLISATEAVESGADGLVHSFMDKVIDENFIKLMTDNKVFMIPTLSVLAAVSQQPVGTLLLDEPTIKPFLSRQQAQQLKASFPDFGISNGALQIAYNNVNKLAAAGIPILAGTDAPNPSTTHGASIHGELRLLVEAGLSNEQAIHSVTGAASKVLPIGSRGTLNVGSMASMILIDGNPFQRIQDSGNITKIWKNGQPITRTRRNKNHKTTKIKPALVNDFNQSISRTTFGRGMAASTDQIVGGHSMVSLKQLNRSENDEYIHVEGEIKKGFMFPWSGFSFLPGDSMQQGVDFSDIESITFDARTGTDSQVISVLIFQQGSFQPYQQTVRLNSRWNSYQIDIKDFGSLDIENIVNLSIVVNNKSGRFEFDLDNLQFR